MTKQRPKDRFFQKMDELGLALTFNDVRLKTGYSEVMPDDVDLGSRFSRNVPLKIPIVSAAMDTVTEHKLAIELAKHGGLGVIHRNLSPEAQSFEVAKVKYHLHGIVDRPRVVLETQTIQEVLDYKTRKDFSFDTFPVLNSEGVLVGIMTRKDFEMCLDNSNLVKDEMTKELITSYKGTSLDEALSIMKQKKIGVLPIVDAENKLIALYAWEDIKRIKFDNQKMYNLDEKHRLRVAAAIGVGEEAFERLEKLVRREVDVVVIDTAHGDSLPVLDTLREIKKQYPNLDVVVGNISEHESAERLCEAGADGIKIGQGPSRICTTRVIAGVGRPQVTAIYNCARIAARHGIPICADGGISYSGDITIAIGSDADSVMIGSMFAGTDEAPGKKISMEGRLWKIYRGMGSLEAMQDHKSSRERYKQEDTGKSQLVPEGVEGLIPYRGPLEEVIVQHVGGLRRGMGYVGAATIEELKDKADFFRMSEGGKQESHPSIKRTKDAPNYPMEQ